MAKKKQKNGHANRAVERQLAIKKAKQVKTPGFRITAREWKITGIVAAALAVLVGLFFLIRALTAPTYSATITVRDYGTITVQLDSDCAPKTVKNFVELAESGFYDGLTFHRIRDGFMMQGGDPDGNGTGGSGKNIKGEFSANGVKNNRSHVRGTISMARATDYNSASSQFFIMQADDKSLDGKYAAFGYVTSGMEIVDQICKDAKPTDGNGTIPAEEQPVIEYITIYKGKAGTAK